MVYEKYIKRGGKVFGPYYYESYRKGEKIYKRYLGTELPRRKFVTAHLIYGIVFLLILVVLLGVFYTFQKNFISSTGKISLDIKSSYNVGEKLDGKLEFNLRAGELIPKNSKIIISFGGETKEFSLSELVSGEEIIGNYFAEGASISGEGEGYGVEGEKIVYPNVNFELRVFENEKIMPKQSETPTQTPSESPVSGLNESPSESPSETPSESPSEQPVVTEPPQENSITGDVVSENEQIVSGVVSKENNFVYNLREGQDAEIVSGSVNAKGEKIEDNNIKLKVNNVKAEVSTEYSVAEKGFGQEYLGNKKLKLQIELSKFDFAVGNESAELNVKLEYNGATLVEAKEDILIKGEGELNKNEENGGVSNETAINTTTINETGANITINKTETNITVTNESIFNETLINETLANKTLINETFVNITTINITTVNITVNITQYDAVLGKPVKWKKVITSQPATNLSVEIPSIADNVSIVRIVKPDEGEESNGSREITVGISGNSIYGRVSAEIELNKEPRFIRWLKSLLKFTGLIVSEQVENSTFVKINESAKEVEIEYYTDAPLAIEEESNNGKRVKINGPETLHYENVLAFTEINESWNVRNPSAVRIYWRESNRYLSAQNVSDRDGNGIYDYIEWNVPSLSNQTFDIILITKAEHLDSNRTFIENVYEQVKARDNNWTGQIPAGDYLRIRFERNLTSDRDITIYARSSTSGGVEVYEKDGEVVIAGFGVISEDKEYKVYLSNLTGEQDTFDLKVVGELGSVEFDWIVDPSSTTISLNSSFDLADIYGRSPVVVGSAQFYSQMKWDISSLPAGIAINNALLCLYITTVYEPLNNNIRVWYINNESWTELASADEINASITQNQSDYNLSSTSVNTWSCFNVTNATLQSYANGNKNFTLRFADPDRFPSGINYVNYSSTMFFSGYGQLDDTRLYFEDKENSGGSGNKPYLNITYTFLEYPQFISYWDNNASLADSGTALFNATIISTNGTVRLDINGANYTAFNTTGNVFNVSVSLTNGGVYSYYWLAWGNGTSHDYNTSGIRYYTVNDTTAPIVTINLPSAINYTISIINFNASLNENGSCMYSLNSGTNNNSMSGSEGWGKFGTNFNATNLTIGDGSYSVNYYCNDTSGGMNNTAWIGFGVNATNLTYCKNLDVADRTYYLASDIFSIGTCFTIIGNNVTMDCKGYAINYSSNGTLGYGAYLNRANSSTIKNCNIFEGNTTTNNKYGIFFHNSTNHKILNNNVSTSGFGSSAIYFVSVNSSSVVNVSINTTGSLGYGVSLFGSDNNTIDRNKITTSSAVAGYGVFVDGSSFNSNITNNVIRSGDEGIYIYFGLNSFIHNNTANSIWFFSSSNTSTVSSNNIRTNTGGTGISLFENSGIRILNNVISASGSFSAGITLQSSNYNTIINNSILVNGSYSIGININSNKHSTIYNTSILVNGEQAYGIEFDNAASTNNTFSWINVTTNATALYISGNHHNFTIQDSILNSPTPSGTPFGLIDFNVSRGVTGGEWNLTNVTRADGSALSKAWGAGANGTLNVHWYLDAYANYTNGSVATNANISTWDVNNILKFSQLTGTNGRIARQTLREYMRNRTTTIYYSNYTINASASNGDTVNQSWNITTNRDLTITFSGDTTAPIVTINSPLMQNYSNLSMNFNVSLNENGSCLYSLNSGNTNVSMSGSENWGKFGTAFNATNTSIADGAHTVRYYCNDTAGNWNNTAWRGFGVDTILPLISISSPQNNSNFVYANVSINYSVSDLKLQACWYTNNSGSINTTITCGNNISGAWGEGTHDIIIYANDSANNVNYSRITFYIDTISPSVIITGPISTTYTGLPITFSITTNENSTAVYSLNSGKDNNSMSANSFGTGFTASNGSMADGTYTIHFYANDTLGNKNNTESVTFSVNLHGTTTTTTTGGGGGGTGVQTTPRSVFEVGTFYIGVNTIERVVNVGEEIFENILITNTARINASVGVSTNMSILIDKSLMGIVSTNNKVEIPPLDSRDVRFRIFGLKQGVYLGNIYFFGEKITEKSIERNINEAGFNVSIANPDQITKITLTNKTYILPMKIVVKAADEKLIDLRVALDRINIMPGENLGFEISAKKLGGLDKYNLSLIYEIVNSEGNAVTAERESLDIMGSLTLQRKLNLPDDLEYGDYELIVKAFYGGDSVSARELFRVGKEVSYSPFLGLGGAFFSFATTYLPLILGVLFIFILIIIGIYYFKYLRQKLFEKKIEALRSKSAYIFPDFGLLPKSHFAYIGQVADSGIKTYLDYTQLNRHTLIAGGTGSGKSVSGMIIAEELLKKRNYPIVVFDPVGQWTGFLKKNEDKKMKSLYRKFGIRGARAFSTKVIEINEKTINLNVASYLKKSGLIVLKLDKLSPKKLDNFIERGLDNIFKAGLSETGSLKSLIVLDEVHRLLPKYGGSRAHIKLEQAVREFRKWGIGLVMISQVLTDFKGAIRGNIGTEIQMRTKYEGDIKRVRDRHGSKISKLIAKMPTGLGMVESSDYNRGNPYFVEFRPLMHSQFKVGEKELRKHLKKSDVILVKELRKNEKEQNIKKERISEVLKRHRRIAKKKRKDRNV